MQTVTGYTFTVFTPTYNRAHTLPRVFVSLQRQTFRDFEWLVVDDGSTDGTPLLVEQFQKDADFPIRYARQAVNSGKHVAFNRGVREATGELFLTLDSDDECVPEALARLKFHWDTIPVDRREQFSAVTSLCMDETGQVVGDRFPEDVLDSDSIELAYRFRVKGEKWGFHKTSVLRAHPFPEAPDMKFVSESLIWFAIARRHRTRFVNECLRIYHGDGGGRLSTLSVGTARGRRIFNAAILNDYSDVRYISPRVRTKCAINYARYSLLCGLGLRAQLRDIHAAAAKGLVVLCAPAALLISLRDGWRAPGRAVRCRDRTPATDDPPARRLRTL
jgi:glycosyltransferase involved in cell wall biosynthesis